jgi:hypothetical protein
MKLLLSRLCFVALLCSSGLFAQNGVFFKYKLSSSEGASGSVAIYYADGNSRSETAMSIPQMPGGGFSRTTLIQKDKPTTMITLDDKAKTWSEREIKERTDNPGADSITVKILGNEKMGGYNCIHSQVMQNKRVSEYWTTKEIPGFEKYEGVHKGSRYMGRANTEAALKKAGAEGFLVKTFSKDQRGVETSLELEKFEKQDVPADKFTVPSAYTKTEPPAGMGQGVDYSKLKDMTPEERQKFIEKMKKDNGGQ